MDWQQIAMLPAVHGAAAFLLVATLAYRAKIVAGVRSASAAIAARLPSRTQTIDAATHVVDIARHDCLRELRHDVSELPPAERTKGLELLDQVDELVRQVEREKTGAFTVRINDPTRFGRVKLADIMDPMGPQLDPDRGGAA